MSFVIEVVDPSGDVMYVRNGPVPGEGAIVQFGTREEAKETVDFFKLGLTEGEDYESIAIVPFREGLPEVDIEGNRGSA